MFVRLHEWNQNRVLFEFYAEHKLPTRVTTKPESVMFDFFPNILHGDAAYFPQQCGLFRIPPDFLPDFQDSSLHYTEVRGGKSCRRASKGQEASHRI